ncbi:MAG: PEGA domain-containing protein [bacterium]
MKILGIIFLLLLFFVLSSCREDVIIYPEKKNRSTIYVDSDPMGAKIYLSTISTGKETPDSLVDLEPGLYALTLKLAGYSDTTTTINLKAGTKPYIYILLKE